MKALTHPHPKRLGKLKAHKLSVMAIFRNEAHLFKEWIEHYFDEGVEHFYLINHNSTDNYLDVIRPYMEHISLVHTKLKSPQCQKIYDKVYSIVDSDWLLVCDIDEFVYARRGYDTIVDFLKDKGENETKVNFNQIVIPSVDFHNAGIEKQPESVVDSFVIRTSHEPISNNSSSPPPISLTKAIIHTGGNIDKHFGVHHHNVNGLTVNGNLTKRGSFNHNNRTWNEYIKELRRPIESLIETSYLKVNHYRFQSKEFYWNVKQHRGDVTGNWGFTDKGDFEIYNNGENMFEHNWRVVHNMKAKKDTELLEKKNNVKSSSS